MEDANGVPRRHAQLTFWRRFVEHVEANRAGGRIPRGIELFNHALLRAQDVELYDGAAEVLRREAPQNPGQVLEINLRNIERLVNERTDGIFRECVRDIARLGEALLIERLPLPLPRPEALLPRDELHPLFNYRKLQNAVCLRYFEWIDQQENRIPHLGLIWLLVRQATYAGLRLETRRRREARRNPQALREEQEPREAVDRRIEETADNVFARFIREEAPEARQELRRARQRELLRMLERHRDERNRGAQFRARLDEQAERVRTWRNRNTLEGDAAPAPANEEVNEEEEQKLVNSVDGFYRIFCKLQQSLAQKQLERSARGLPEQDVVKFDPLALTQALLKIIDSPEVATDGFLDSLMGNMQKLAEKIDNMEATENQPPPSKRQRLPGKFQLPPDVRESLSGREVQILENCVDLLRKAMTNGMEFPGIRAVQGYIDKAQKHGRTNDLLDEAKLTEVVEKIVKTEEYKRRVEEYKKERVRRGLVRNRPGRLFRAPESENLYMPHIPKDDYELWTEEDISDWIKLFIPIQAHRDLVEEQHFNGASLENFLHSKIVWKMAGWPFGLYVRMNTHFNRVVNHRNGFSHTIFR